MWEKKEVTGWQRLWTAEQWWIRWHQGIHKAWEWFVLFAFPDPFCKESDVAFSNVGLLFSAVLCYTQVWGFFFFNCSSHLLKVKTITKADQWHFHSVPKFPSQNKQLWEGESSCKGIVEAEAGKLVYLVRTLATLLENPSSIPSAYMMANNLL